MPSHRPAEHEDVEAWRNLAGADLAHLRSLTVAQLGAEVMRRGFAGLPAAGQRTRIGLSNSLCPVAPSMMGGDDMDVVQQYGVLLAPVLSALENAGLLRGETRGRSALRHYGVTARGQSALEDDGVEIILGGNEPDG